MNTKTTALLSFMAGVSFTALIGFAYLVYWNGQQSQLLWTTVLHENASRALKLSRGENNKVLQDLEQQLPGMVLSVNSFGDNAHTHAALVRAKEFYQQTGHPMPQQIAGILGPLIE